MKGYGESEYDYPPFMECSKCRFLWPARQTFLEDSNLIIIGYQLHFQELAAGLFLFNHSCMTTLAVEAGRFQDLGDGPIFRDRLAGTTACPEYCLQRDDLRPCSAKCELAYVREILQIIKNWPKKTDRTKGKEVASGLHP